MVGTTGRQEQLTDLVNAEGYDENPNGQQHTQERETKQSPASCNIFLFVCLFFLHFQYIDNKA